MVKYSYKHQPKTVIQSKAVERLRGAPIPVNSFCKNPKPKNISGNPLEQLEEQYYNKSVDAYPGTLVVIVGNNALKLAHTINLYNKIKPPQQHDMVIVYNGGNPRELVDNIPEVPHNCICEPILIPNWGWDVRMYAEAVFNWKYDRYFFMNDDLISVGGNNWLAEMDREIENGAGVIGVQGHFFIRTSYYGATRLFWLSMITAILSNCIVFSAHRLRRIFPYLHRLGAIDAFCFEAVGKYFASKCGFGIGWLDSPHNFLDRNCIRYKGICASQWKEKPVPYFIESLGHGLEEQISVDYVINWARQYGLRDFH